MSHHRWHGGSCTGTNRALSPYPRQFLAAPEASDRRSFDTRLCHVEQLFLECLHAGCVTKLEHQHTNIVQIDPVNLLLVFRERLLKSTNEQELVTMRCGNVLSNNDGWIERLTALVENLLDEGFAIFVVA